MADLNRREAIKRFAAQSKNRVGSASAGARINAMRNHLPEDRPTNKRSRYLTDNEPGYEEEIPIISDPKKAKKSVKSTPEKGLSKTSKLAPIIIVVLAIALGAGLAVLLWVSQDLLEDFPVLAGSEVMPPGSEEYHEGYEEPDIYEEYYNSWEYDPEEYIYAWPPEDKRLWWAEHGEAPDTSEIDEFFASLSDNNNVSMFFMNLDTGFIYTHNPERVYFAASLSKSNHAFYVFTLAERGYIDLDEIHYYTAEDRWGGTGVLRFMDEDMPFTTRELLGLSIRESDNAAYRMLVRQTERMAFSYRDLVTEIGASTRMIQNVISQNTNAYDAGLWMYAIFNYLESESQFGHYFKYDLMNTSQTSHPYFERWDGSYGRGGEVNVSMIQADYPMARKYGWARNAFHDAAIVYATSPYILVILSNMDRGAHDLFEEISLKMQDFNYRWFTTLFALS